MFPSLDLVDLGCIFHEYPRYGLACGLGRHHSEPTLPYLGANWVNNQQDIPTEVKLQLLLVVLIAMGIFHMI